jgi:hypothetical protein
MPYYTRSMKTLTVRLPETLVAEIEAESRELQCAKSDAVVSTFDLADQLHRILDLMQKYADVPMSMADACLVRMSETLADPVLLTTDADFPLYRRHSRHVAPA